MTAEVILMQSEYIITILSVITAGLSPVVLTYMNHRHDVKIRDLELRATVQQSVEIDFNKSKAEAFQNVFLCANAFLSSLGDGCKDLRFCELSSAIGVASLYCSDDSVEILNRLTAAAGNLFTMETVPNYDDFTTAIEQLQSSFRQDLRVDK